MSVKIEFKDKSSLLKFINQLAPGLPSITSIQQLSSGVFFLKALQIFLPGKIQPEKIMDSNKQSDWLKNFQMIDKIIAKMGLSRIDPQKLVKGRFYEMSILASYLKGLKQKKTTARPTLLPSQVRQLHKQQSIPVRKSKDRQAQTINKQQINKILFMRSTPQQKVSLLMRLMGHSQRRNEMSFGAEESSNKKEGNDLLSQMQ